MLREIYYTCDNVINFVGSFKVIRDYDNTHIRRNTYNGDRNTLIIIAGLLLGNCYGSTFAVHVVRNNNNCKAAVLTMFRRLW